MDRFVLKFNNMYYGSYIGNHTISFSSRGKINSNKTDYSSEITKTIKLTGNYQKKINDIFNIGTISHNLTIAYTSDQKLIGVGGVCTTSCNAGKYNKGIYLIEFKDNELKINKISLLINREMSLKQDYGTHFDSQPSFFYNPNNKKYFLYTRYNEKRGSRKCQVFTSNNYNCNFEKGILINFIGENNIYIYNQYVYLQNNQFVGLFKYYIGLSKQPRNRKYLKATSKDGINFKIEDMNFLNLKDDEYICQNHEKIADNKNIFYIIDRNGIFTKKIN